MSKHGCTRKKGEEVVENGGVDEEVVMVVVATTIMTTHTYARTHMAEAGDGNTHARFHM